MAPRSHSSLKVPLLVKKQLSEEDREFVRKCFEKFQALYEASAFIGQPTCCSYGGFSYSKAYFYIIQYFGIGVKNHAHTVFLCEIMENASKILGGRCCTLGITLLDKKYAKDGLKYHEYDGLESYSISKSKYIYKMIEEQLGYLSDEELGKLIRNEMQQEPRKYNKELDEFLSQDERLKCKTIFNNWFEGCFSEEDDGEKSYF